MSFYPTEKAHALLHPDEALCEDCGCPMERPERGEAPKRCRDCKQVWRRAYDRDRAVARVARYSYLVKNPDAPRARRGSRV